MGKFRFNKNQFLSLFLAFTMAVNFMANTDLTNAAFADELPYINAQKGIWITEIYQNDTHTLWYEYHSGGTVAALHVGFYIFYCNKFIL